MRNCNLGDRDRLAYGSIVASGNEDFFLGLLR